MTLPGDQRLSRPGGPWTAGGFGNWLIIRIVVLLLTLLLIGILLPASIGSSSGVHPRMTLMILRDTSGQIVANANPPDPQDIVGRTDWFTYRHPLGFPVAFLEREHHALVIQVSDTTVLQSQCRAAVAQFLNVHTNDSGPSNYAFSKYSARIASGDFDIVSLSPSGIAIDTLTFLAVLAFFLWTASRIRRAYRHATHVARRAAGLCPTCAYDTLDLNARICPECGTHLRPTPPPSTDL